MAATSSARNDEGFWAGRVAQQFSMAFPVAPYRLTPYLPLGGELRTQGGFAWLVTCFLHIPNLRPASWPAPLGTECLYVIHQTPARLAFPDGSRRETDLIIDASVGRKGLRLFGSRLGGIDFAARSTTFVTDGASFRIGVLDQGAISLDVLIRKSSYAGAPPAGSPFVSLEAADQFINQARWRSAIHPRSGQLTHMAQQASHGQARMGTCDTRCHQVLEVMGATYPRADCVLASSGFDIRFAMRGQFTDFEPGLAGQSANASAIRASA